MPEEAVPVEVDPSLRRREEVYRTSFTHAGLGIGHTDLNGRWIMVNPALCEITGYSNAQLLKKTFQELTVPEDLAEDLGLFARLKKNEISSYSVCKRYVHQRGHQFWIELTATMVRPTGEPPFAIAIIRDATDVKLARAELERLIDQKTAELGEVRFESEMFFVLSPDVLVVNEVIDGVAYVRRANPAFCQLLGYSEDELRNIPLRKFIYPDDIYRSVEFTRIAHLNTGTSFENRFVTSDGSVRWLSWTVRRVDGRYYCVGRDVTKSKDRARSELQHEQRLAATSKINALGRMAANISHEIKNPLTVVYANACQLQNIIGDVPDAVRRMIGEIETMSLRIVKIVDGLRGFTREASHDPIEAVSLSRLLEDTLSFCNARFTMDGVEFHCEPVAEDLTLYCQPVQIQQVLLNLLNNAYDAASATSQSVKRMGIRHAADETTVSILVYDNGEGVDPAIRPQIFEPFFTTKQIGKGTGLGLNIARVIVESHRGRIYLDESQADTTFVVELPRAPV